MLVISYVNATIFIQDLNRRGQMQPRSKPDSLGEIIHKKKEAKKKQKTKGLLSIDNRKGSTPKVESQQFNRTEVRTLLDNRQEQTSRTRNQIKNQEIDEQLFSWLSEGLIAEQYMGFFAKACHTLGTTKMNELAINSRNGKQPQRLFAYKVKGAIQLHFKRQYFNNNDSEDKQQ